MEIAESTTQQSSTAAVQSSTVAAPTTTLTSDFDSFIKMLTAQARYQDPLDPIDSTEFASQLAQFSMVEQQVLTNDMLAALYGLTGTSNMASLAGWVGMEARANTPMYFDGNPIDISPNPYILADEVYMVVTDDAGNEVQRTQIEVSDDTVQWHGYNDNGELVDHGLYSFTIESYADGELVIADPAEVYARIDEAQVIQGEVVLVLEGGQSVLATSISALRSPS